MDNVKLPPQNLEAEESVIGGLLLDEEAIYKIAEIIEPEHFYDKRNRAIYQSIIRLYTNHKPIDVLTLASELRSNKQLNKVGGAKYLSGLVAKVPTSAHIVEYANLIKETSIRRRLITLGAEMEEIAYKEDQKLDEIIDKVEQSLVQVAQSNAHNDFIHVSELLEEVFERAEELNKDPGKLRGIPTGFSYLDGILGGLQKSDLIILAARPSVGKTAFSLDLARHAAVNEKKSVAVFSLEMSSTQLMDRILSMEAGIGLWDLRMGRIQDSSFSKLSDAMGILSEAALYIDDTPGIGIMEMRTKARKLKIEHGLDLIIVDYLQLITGRHSENRVQEVSEISRMLKGLARELDVPVVALAQLSRAVEQRGDGLPQLSDLRDSGSIEQDADIVIFLSRVKSDEETSENRLLSVSKHRNGATGSIELFFHKEQARFRELDKMH